MHNAHLQVNRLGERKRGIESGTDGREILGSEIGSEDHEEW
jgi:hypothetical protein